MDWRNRLDQIKNKLKLQLHSKGIDNLNQLQGVFDVNNIFANIFSHGTLTSRAVSTSLSSKK